MQTHIISQTFLWKGVNIAQKIGQYWLNIPSLESRGTCETCDELETMDHILFDCPENGEREVWELVNEILEKRGMKWKKTNGDGTMS